MRIFDMTRNAVIAIRFAAIIAAILTATALPPAAGLFAQEVPDAVRERSNDLDVPFVTSDDNVLKAMFEMAKPTRDDFLIDLGSGDGRIVIAAARAFGLRGFGVDLNEGLVRIANQRAAAAGVADRVQFHVRDLFKTDIDDATILTMYLLPDVVLELRERLVTQLKPGTRIVSHDYHLGDWRPDDARVVSIDGGKDESVVYFWTVPASVAGTWEWTIADRNYSNAPGDFRVVLNQQFQDVVGTAEIFPGVARLHDIRLVGDRISFSVSGEVDERMVRHDFRGRVAGDEISGAVTLGGGVHPRTLPWSARRVAAPE